MPYGPFESLGRDVVALVDDNQAVASEHLGVVKAARDGLEHREVDDSAAPRAAWARTTSSVNGSSSLASPRFRQPGLADGDHPLLPLVPFSQ
jgi:hypothetical protein